MPHDSDYWSPLYHNFFALTSILEELYFLVELQGQGLNGVLGQELKLVCIELSRQLLQPLQEDVSLHIEEAGKPKCIRCPYGYFQDLSLCSLRFRYLTYVDSLLAGAGAPHSSLLVLSLSHCRREAEHVELRGGSSLHHHHRLCDPPCFPV